MSFFSFTPTPPSVSVSEAADKIGQAAFIDVRMPYEYATGHAKGADNCPLPKLRDCVEKLKLQAAVYVICQSGGRSSSAVSMLRSLGINAFNISGGTFAWRAQGLPMA